MIIDFHTHILPPSVKENRDRYIDSDPCFALIYSNPKAKIATAEELIRSMDENEVDVSVVLNYGWTTHDLCVEVNDYIFESVAKYPDRLVGFCSVQPNSSGSAVAEIERCVKAGAKGVGEFRPDLQVFDFRDDTVMKPILEAIKKYRLILVTHSSEPLGHEYPGKGMLTPDIIFPFVASLPGVNIVCAHWGGGLPFYALMPEVSEGLKSVYFDSAASPLLYSPQVYRQVIELVGAEKVLFGTDYPLLPPKRLLKEIDSLKLPDKDRALMLSENARRLLGIKGR